MRPADDAVCSSEDSRVKCVGRWDATLRGDFLYHFEAHGWLWTAFADRVFKRCPWCLHALPNQAAIYDRLRKGIAEEE